MHVKDLQDWKEKGDADQIEEIGKLKVLRSTECSEVLSENTQKSSRELQN